MYCTKFFFKISTFTFAVFLRNKFLLFFVKITKYIGLQLKCQIGFHKIVFL